MIYEPCIKCGATVKVVNNEDLISKINSATGLAPPDKSVEVRCADCTIALMEDLKKEFNFPSVDWLIACKLLEYDLPPTRRNIEWYQTCLRQIKDKKEAGP